ncbi:MAG: cupin domain-containing protein [Thermaceae bacterium]|nr:cupin domain-containing protein [Thermaceae bacterium]
MAHPAISSEEMQQRIVRFNQLKNQGIPLMFIDSILPGHQRMNYAVIGDTASENAEFKPAIAAPHKFQIGMGFALPGNGPAYHTHDYVEAFLVLEGQWRFYWGNEPGQVEGEAILKKWDFISLPPGLYRGFEVVGTEVGWFFAVLDPHEVFHSKDPYWDPEVERKAAEYGFKSDPSGKMVKPENYPGLKAQMMQHLTEVLADWEKQRLVD